MRTATFLVLAILGLYGCGTDNSVQGGADHDRAGGVVTMGVPF